MAFTNPFTNHLVNQGGGSSGPTPNAVSTTSASRAQTGFGSGPNYGSMQDSGGQDQLIQDFAQQMLSQPAFMPFAGLTPHQNGYNLTGGNYQMMPGSTAQNFMENPDQLWTYWVNQGVNQDHRHMVAPHMDSAWADFQMRSMVDPDFSMSWAQYLSSVDPMSYVSPEQMAQFQHQQASRAHAGESMGRQQERWGWDPNQELERMQFDASNQGTQRQLERWSWDPNQEFERRQFEDQQRRMAEQNRQMQIQRLRERSSRRFDGAPRWLTY